jgi:YCII-related domain
LELIAGFSILQVKSLDEAIEWVKRGPNCGPGDYEVEIRQVFEMEDFAPVLTEEQIKHKVAKRAELPLPATPANATSSSPAPHPARLNATKPWETIPGVAAGTGIAVLCGEAVGRIP